MKCGAEIPEDVFYCPKCASPVQLVPDYASLENLLAGEINDLLGNEVEETMDKTRVMRTDDVRRQRSSQNRGVKTAVGRQTVNMTPINRYSDPNLEMQNTTRIGGGTARPGGVSQKTANMSQRPVSRQTGTIPRQGGSVSSRNGNTASRTGARSGQQSAGSMAHRQGQSGQKTAAANRERLAAERRRQQKKKQQRRNLIIIIALILVIFAAGAALLLSLNSNSYSGVMSKAEKAYDAKQYDEAIELYTKAAGIKEKKADPYVGIAKCYLEKEEEDNAETVLLKAVKIDDGCVEAYQLLIGLYEEQENYEAISELMSEVTNKGVLKACADYAAEAPEISPAGGTYDKPVEITMKVGKGEIHYTTDGTEPTADSPVYTEKVKLEGSGTYEVRAITINAKGYRSLESAEDFKLEMDGPESPSVTPAAGSYDSDQRITVDIPTGCRVFYTLDGSDPTKNSTEYTGPVTMPEGQSTFSCIAIDEYDQVSSVIRRQYNLMSLD